MIDDEQPDELVQFLQKQTKFKSEFDKRVKNHNFESDCKIDMNVGDEQASPEVDNKNLEEA